MFRTIVVPLDGTPFAEHAVPTALMLARASQGRLVLAHVYVPPPVISDATVGVVVDARVLAELEAAARDYLEAVTGRVAAHAGVPVESVMLCAAAPHAALHDLAAERGADLIVLATHDRSALGRLLTGSVAERVARAPGIPVLLVRRAGAQLAHGREGSPAAAADPTALPASSFRHILVALDGSAVAEAVFEPARALAHACGAAMTLLAVHAPQDVTPTPPARSAAFEYLQNLMWRLRGDGLAVDIREREGRDVAGAIVDCAAAVGADVIAMGTHGRGALARLVEGSVAGDVLHAVLLPVLLLHPEPGEADSDATSVGAQVAGAVPPPA